MALHDDFGVPENDEGEWVEYAQDPETKKIVEVKLRPMPIDKALEIERKYGREVMVNDPDTGRRRPHRERTEEEGMALFIEKADWVTLNLRNYEVRLRDAEAADFYTRHLREAVPLAAPCVIVLDDRINTAVKRRLFMKNIEFATWCIENSEKLKKKVNQKNTQLLGNS